MNELEQIKVEEQVRIFINYFEKHHLAVIHENARIGVNFIVVDFMEFAKFNTKMADAILDDPEDTIKAAELAIEQFDGLKNKGFRIRFTNIPNTQQIKIVDSRKKHLKKLIKITAEINTKSEVMLEVVSSKFECPQCGNILNVLQLDQNYKEPSRCGCGRKGKFKLLEEDITDVQEISIIDTVDKQQEGDMYQELTVLLKEDLTRPVVGKEVLQPNSTVNVYGYFKDIHILQKGLKTTRKKKLFQANYIELAKDDRKEFYPNEKEIKEFKTLSKKQDFMNKLIEGFAPEILGLDIVKEALLLQLVGGVKRYNQRGGFRRGNMHMALVGDPGKAKSALMLVTCNLYPRSRFVTGTGTSAVGLAGGVKRNQFIEGFAADPGALAMANKSILAIDESDKIEKEDLAALNTGMEQQFTIINKAGIYAKFEADTRVLLGANPKDGRFNPYADSLIEQFRIDPTTLSRLDLVFTIKDTPNEKEDEKIARHILDIDSGSKSFDEKDNPFFNINTLRKYIQAITHLKPRLSDDIKEEIVQAYKKMRMINFDPETKMSAMGATIRQLHAIERLAEASAKLFFREIVSKEDVGRSLRLMEHYLKETCTDPETGKIDIDRITTGITTSQRSHIHEINEIIRDLENKIGKTIPIQDIVDMAQTKNMDSNKVDEIIERLKRSGDIMEVRPGYISFV